LFGLVFLFQTDIPWITAGIVLVIDGLALLSLVLLKRGRVRTASLIFTLSLWAAVTYIVVRIHGGMASPALPTYLLVIMVAGLLLWGKLVFAIGGLILGTVAAVFFFDRAGLIPPPLIQLLPYHSILYSSLNLSLATFLLHRIISDLNQALRASSRDQRALAVKNNELEEARLTLEQRIDTRTAELGARTAELAARTEELATRSEEILQQKQFYQALVENTPLAIVSLDCDHRIVSCNPAFETLFGYPAGEVAGQSLDPLITTPESRDEAGALTRQALSGQEVQTTTRRRRKDGSLVWVEINAVPVTLHSRQIGVLALYNDISARRRAEEHLEFLAKHDPLTVLPNRAYFYERLNQAVERARATSRLLAVMFLDLDGFKQINDNFGHARGDQLIRCVANRLTGHLRKDDLVARLGGDEFAFIFEDLNRPEDAAIIARKILTAMATPFQVDGCVLSVTASLGLSLYPQDGKDAEVLLHNADSAMYRVKDLGKNDLQFFSSAGSVDLSCVA
jgi:diguanylate cyclase (GGDEF)-like protein/PAS domain S-box-containing protein